jgi:hypothetical protein
MRPDEPMSTNEPVGPRETCEGSVPEIDYGWFDDAELRELHRSGDDEARAKLERRGLSTKSLAQAEAHDDTSTDQHVEHLGPQPWLDDIVCIAQDIPPHTDIPLT